MDSGHHHGKKTRNDDNNNNNRATADRLSSLPDDLIHKILSFISIRDTVKTIALSSRYRFIWTTMTCLNFSTQDFPRLQKFSKFVTRFLKRRDTRIDVSSLNLSFRGEVTQPFVKKLMDYAFSHNIQRLEVTCLLENNIEFPLSLFRSMSLKHLSLGAKLIETYRSVPAKRILRATSTLELPSLTTLCLHDVSLRSDDDKGFGFLSKCANLKNLTLRSCAYKSSSFSICHNLGLANLALEGLQGVKVVNVVAPQLENLIIRVSAGNTIREHVISAPDLTSLVYESHYPLHLISTHGNFPSLKEANICYSDPYWAHSNTKLAQAHDIVRLFQHLRNVKFLTLNLEIIELLFSSVELISHQPCPFVNLKSLTIYPKHVNNWPGLGKLAKANLFTEVKNYVLDSSPGATFSMVSREDIIAVKNVASARKLMDELQVLLEQEIANNTKTKGKAPMENNNAKMSMSLQIGENIALIKSCWNDLSVQFNQRKAKACLIISKLESIEDLITTLPAPHRAMIQPCFSSLCTKAVIVMSKLTNCMTIQCDENQSRLNARFLINLLMEPSS